MTPHRIRVSVLAAALLLAAGCGEEEQAETPAATRTPEATETPTPTATPTQAPKKARSVRECAELWNADELRGSTHQVSATDFVADLHRDGRRQVAVDYQKPDCWVVVPLGPRRIMTFAAPGGEGNYHNPRRQTLEPGQGVKINARTRPDGRIALTG
jgi:hypothetical protein